LGEEQGRGPPNGAGRMPSRWDLTLTPALSFEGARATW
jgi:hypothetical protein